MHAALETLLQNIAPLSSSEMTEILGAFQSSRLKKGDYFLQSGEVNQQLGFIVKGLVRYYVFKNDEEATFEFTPEGEFIGDYQSFSKQVPSLQNIQAIEECELLVIDFASVQHIYNHTIHGNLIGRTIIEHRFDVMVNQLLSIYMHNEQERYQRFVKQYSYINQRIPQYLVASYVGVKPQSLSRIRKRTTL